MTTTTQQPSVVRPLAPRIDDRVAACVCGQELDLVAGVHCPRCGTQLGQQHFEAVGFWRAA